jgi:hypothetical protein
MRQSTRLTRQNVMTMMREYNDCTPLGYHPQIRGGLWEQAFACTESFIEILEFSTNLAEF